MASLLYKLTHLSNSGATALNVNGSVTPQEFTFTPGAGEVWLLNELRLIIQDPGGDNFDEFGNLAGILGGIGALTNGLLVTIKSKGTSQDYCNIKDNGDLVLCANQVWSPPTGTSITNETTTTIVSFTFDPPIKIQSATSDFVKIIVRDNISNVNFLRAMVQVSKEF